jgi:glycosyltransferase involved in cell wall biosynthesis
VVDDGSNDDTLATAESFRAYFPIKIIARHHEGNWVKGTNVGISHALGEWVSILHQDDGWHPDRLRSLRAAVRDFNQVGFFFHPTRLIDRNDHGVGIWRTSLKKNVPLDPSIATARLIVHNTIGPASPLFRREVALSVGGMDETLWFTADWDFWLKLAAHTASCYLGTPLAYFRLHSHSQTVMRRDRWKEMRSQWASVQQKHLERWEARYGSSPCLRAVTEFNQELSFLIVSLVRRERPDWRGFLTALGSLRVGSVLRFFNDSRIHERLYGGLRVGPRKLRGPVLRASC